MQLARLSLLNFRNYREANIHFFDGVHVIYGENGAGKTTILEAIHYLALTKSFRTAVDKHLIFDKEKMFRIQGDFTNRQGQAIHTTIAYSRDSGKHLTANGQKLQKFSEYIGEVPVVLLHPADLSLSQGSPQQRRRFLDILLSQSSKLYLHHLIQYNRSLKQRNQLLLKSQEAPLDPQLLISWEENLIHHGAEIIRKRQESVVRLSELVKSFYGQLSRKADQIKIIYQRSVPEQKGEDLHDTYRRLFAEKRSREQAYGSTIIGPHRDDLLFLINGRPAKAYASQGEHKTFVIALKLGEFQHLEQQRDQAPILLFDDIFGELDAGRIEEMLNQLSDIGQVFVTTTSRNFFDKISHFKHTTHYYAVQNGTIDYQTETPENRGMQGA